MEDDDEIQSHPSAYSGSPSSPSPNGRITVTVAAAPPHQSSSNIALALPIQHQPPSRPSGNGGGREDCWSEGATSVLIDAWGERYMELSRGNLKQKHWKEVADIVSSREDYTKPPKTDIQCKNRIDTVKKKYKSEKSKIAVGMGPSKWSFYDRLEQLIGPTTTKISSAAAAGAGTSTSTPASNKVVPMGIPVGVRSVHQLQTQPRQKPKPHLRRRPPVNSDTESSRSEPEPPSPDSTDSFPPATYLPKRPKYQHHHHQIANPSRPMMNQNLGMGSSRGGGGEEKNINWGNSVRELTRAIVKFGEAYEQAESSKLQQLVEMEKQRMKFTKEIELQRMQFFMKTQLELSQLKHNSRVAGNNSHHHPHSNNNNSNMNMNNNSDSSS